MEMSRNEASLNTAEWTRRIQALNESRSPELLQQVQERANRQREITQSMTLAADIERRSYYSSASSALALRSFTTSRVENNKSKNVLNIIFQTFSTRQATVSVQSNAPAGDFAKKTDTNDDLENEHQLRKEEVENTFHQMDEELATVFQINTSDANTLDAAFDQVASEVDQLLGELETEPADETEMAVKFGLYETFLTTVETLRSQTLAFWENNQHLFAGGTKAVALKKIEAIDSEEALGIEDEDGTSIWFVYWMMKKANSNSAKIQGVLSSLRANLELLAAQDIDCPFCLESIVTEEETVTLGCCHKSCSTCWNHWVKLKGASAFCPLCKHEEFLYTIYQAASSTSVN